MSFIRRARQTGYQPRHQTNTGASTVARHAAGAAAATVLAAGFTAAAAPSASAASVWDRVAACESGGNWSISTGNGYHGGLQFSRSTWLAHGGGQFAPTANKATKAQQIAIAKKTLTSQGPGAWPTCSRKAGLTRTNGMAAGASAVAAKAAQAKKVTAAKAPSKAVNSNAYTVKRGDTLSRIARAHKVAGGYRTLATVNKLSNPNLIHVGQRLTIPA